MYTKIIKNIIKNERVRRDIYYYTESFKKNRNKNNIETCSKMKEDVGIVITNNYNIAVNFEYCLLLDTVPAENISTVSETE